MSVKNVDEFPREPVKGGKHTERQVLIGPDQAPHFAMRRFVMQPGGGIPRHMNTVEHEQYVLRGQARIGVGDEVYDVRVGDVTYIPAGTPHWYEVTGGEPFEFICVVPNAPDKITMLDE